MIMVITWLPKGLLASLKMMSVSPPPPNQGNTSPQRWDRLVQELAPHTGRVVTFSPEHPQSRKEQNSSS